MESLGELVGSLTRFYIPLAAGLIYGKVEGGGDLPRGLSRVILSVFLPLLLFSSIYAGNPRQAAEDFMLVTSSALFVALVSLVSSLLLTRGDRVLMLLSVYLNSGYLPLPLVYIFWGRELTSLVGFYILVNVTVGFLLAPFLLSRGTFKESIKNIAKFPPVPAILLGFIASLAGIAIPSSLLDSITQIGDVAPYLALFVVGFQASQTGRPPSSWVKVALTRFVVAPAASYALLPHYLGWNTPAFKVVLLESMMPPAVTNAVLATEFNTKPEEVASMVVALNVVATVTAPIFAIYLSLAG